VTVALSDLLDAVAREAELEIAAELAAAEADATVIRDAAARARAARLATHRRASETARRESLEARVAEARRRTRAHVLAARLAMLERLREAVLAELPGALVRAAAPVATALADAACTAAAGGAGAARCHPMLLERVRTRAPQLEVAADESITGIVIELASGTRIEATLTALLEREWSRLAPEALALVEEAA
jgi:hypothetical protein